MDTKTLEEIGLTKIEAEVYLALLKLGTTTAWPLIKKTELHKSTIYNTLERLIEKGLVSFIIKNNTRYYEANEPLILMAKLEEQENKLTKTKADLKKLIPELQKIKKIAPKQAATLFIGKSGLKAAYEILLKERKKIYAYVTAGKFQHYMPIYYQQFQNKRAKLGIKLILLASEAARKKREKILKTLPLTETRYVQIFHEISTNLILCNDKVVFVVWSDQPIILFIQSKEIAKNQLIYFEHLWKTAKK